MGSYFVDSSALVKRYVNETGSEWLSALVAPEAHNDIYIARITTVEVIAALTRRARGGSLIIEDARAACLLFQDDLLYDYEIVDVTTELLNRAMTLASVHALRGYDAVQLAAAVAVNTLCTVYGLPPLTLISADRELNAAGIVEGLVVDDPNLHAVDMA